MFKRSLVDKLAALALLALSLSSFAQEAGEELAEQAGTSIWDILYGGSIINLIIWIAIFLTSFAMLWFAIDSFLLVRRDKLLPPSLVEGVRQALAEGDLDGAVASCQAHPGSLANILQEAFDNIYDGYEVVQQAVSSRSELENEKLMQRVNLLNVCGQIAPMLGLMGTVVGMVLAFAGLASATGAAKARVLANSISTALWTTCIGLLVSVPALLFFTFFRNNATRLLIESEATVLELIKPLRKAVIEE
ncbi:MAG: MotA/TolQ/ExbB proton channel family protein [Lentisphaeria bacterium]|jgi:biopolymer transport protein ExbB|nr:MotA/TolQ/ExbB proton channel family protein [Lentisphaeria bacterium]NLZ60364.1 MotA/TolQ/ExbB proton channel family protein [Lentisphaerota bacterium]